MPKITKIEDHDDINLPSGLWEGGRDMEGFVVHLDDGRQLCIGIDNSQSCCENWGHVCSQDDFDQFVGAEFFGYDIVDEELAMRCNRIADTQIYRTDLVSDSGGFVFLNVNTSEGTLVFTVYNDHNGYYGHEATVTFGNEVVHNEYL